jgi:phage portal protein BeeE
MSEQAIKRNKLSQADFAKLTMKAAMEKKLIQEKITNGASVQDLATHYNVSPSTMKDVLEVLEIKYGQVMRATGVHSELMQALLTVVARVARKCDVSFEEIQPYLVNEK